MPFRNSKGPLGEGPLTGRGFGPCEGDRSNLNFVGFGFGRGFGRNQEGFFRGRRGRKGRGRGFGYRCFDENQNPDKKTFLKNYRESLEKELEDIKKEEENLS